MSLGSPDQLNVSVALEGPTISVAVKDPEPDTVVGLDVIRIQAGPQGPQGPQGDTGPQGSPGGAVLSSTWNYNIATTGPPAAGQVRTSPATLAIGQPMTMYLSGSDAAGLIWTGANLRAGDDIRLRSTSGATVEATVTDYTMTGSGATGYATINAVVNAGSGTMVKQASVEVALIKELQNQHYAGISPGRIIPDAADSGPGPNYAVPQTQIFANIAATRELAWTVTPTVDCWWRLVLRSWIRNTAAAVIGRLQFSLNLIDPTMGSALPDANGVKSFYGGAIHSNAWGDFAPFELSALFALTANTAYKCRASVDFQSPSTGPWQSYYTQGIHGLDNLGAVPRY